MKVLIVVYRDSEISGGSVRVAEIIVRAMLKFSVDVNVAVAYGENGRLAALIGGKIYFARSSGPISFINWVTYRKFIRDLKPDVIHYVDSVGWMVLAGYGLPAKRVMHQHIRPNMGPNGHKRLLRIRWIDGTADKIVAISHGAGRQLVDLCGIRQEKIEVIHNAVDSDYLRKKLDDADYSKDKCILGMAVRVVNDKGLGDALNLLAILPERFNLVIAGDGPDLPYLKNRASDLGIKHRVTWLGSISDISGFYFDLDFYLFMSWYEGFGLSVAEAMASRVPIVGLLGDGEITEKEYPLLTDENSILIKRSNPNRFALESDVYVLESLRDAIISLDQDRNRRQQLVNAAETWIKERFYSNMYGDRVLAMYEKMLN